MNILQLNTLSLGGDVIKKGASSGGSNPPSSPSGGGATRWTGHADADGLRAIGWTEEDIAYYQKYGVKWDEEDDQYHLVPDDNKALYGVLTASNITSYRNRIVYLPKIDTSSVTVMYQMFQNCSSMVAIPKLDTSKATTMYMTFNSCYSLVCVPQMDMSNVTNMSYMFSYCGALSYVPQMDTSKATNMSDMFLNCNSLVSAPRLDTSSVTSVENMFHGCSSLVSTPQLDISSATSVGNMFSGCSSLMALKLKNVKLDCKLKGSPRLNKESLLYLINNEAATSAITITLYSYAYSRWAEDADVVAALANHPNISLAST